MSRTRKFVTRLGVPAAVLLALSACGGGGDSGGMSIPSTPAPTTVSGTVSKGLVKQARVLACRIVNGAPEADASCAAATSGNDGSFMVTMSDGYTGPAMIKVMAGTASMMADETTGADIPYAMTMRALVPAVSAATTVYVTPFSEMAAAAMGAGNMDADKMQQAMAAVQTLMTGMGIDLTVMPMVDLKNNGTDSAMLGRQANMVQQLTRVMMAARNDSTLKDANGTACNATGTTSSQQVTCAVSAMAGVMTGVTTSDPAKTAVMMAALTSQNVSTVHMPVRRVDGTLTIQATNMTSSQSMQTAMQNAGMTTTTAANAANIMMQGMR